MKNKGFTLIELVLIIGLLVLTAGVSSDIIISLIRTYNKIQITNEIEQSADFVLLKLEKELRNATSVSSVASNILSFYTDSGNIVTYKVESDVILRSEKPPSESDSFIPLTDNTFLRGGVSITCTDSCFTRMVSEVVDVIKINITFSQTAGISGAKAFEGTVPIETTIVVRGSY